MNATGHRETVGRLIVNADDWGQDRHTTECISDCIRRGTISSASAMVFMSDSERAAEVARESALDVGLHLNFTAPFTAKNAPATLVDHHDRTATYLRRHRLAQLVFNPALMRSFQYVVSAQLEEFERLYGEAPTRLDGHHHMHLCANVLVQRLLPPGTRVRRHFHFRSREKGILNRAYRGLVDYSLRRRHLVVDYFFALAPLHPATRLQDIVRLADRHVVELETHPVNADEYALLTTRPSLFSRSAG